MNDFDQIHIPPGMLSRIIHSKQEIILYYETLYGLAPDGEDSDIVKSVHQDEMMQLRMFIDLYVRLFGRQPELTPPAAPAIESFASGAKRSVMLELRFYELYRNIFFTDQTDDVRQVFLQALTNEIMHSAKFNYLYIGTR